MGTSWIKRRAGKAAAASVMAAAIASMAFVQGAGASSGEPHAMRTHGAHAASPSGGNLVDNKGPVLSGSKTYAIWWGSWGSTTKNDLGYLLGGFSGSSYFNTAAQYMRGNPLSTIYQGASSDTTSPPAKVSPSTLGNEVSKVFHGVVDPSAIYFVYTSNFPRGGNFCAWHSYATVNGVRIAVAYMPNTTGIAGCDPNVTTGTYTTDEGVNSLANVTAHEFMESITDPQPANGTYAWIDSSGSEIGDKCAWTFNGLVTLSDGKTWKLQQEWSNAAGGCVEGTA